MTLHLMIIVAIRNYSRDMFDSRRHMFGHVRGITESSRICLVSKLSY